MVARASSGLNTSSCSWHFSLFLARLKHKISPTEPVKEATIVNGFRSLVSAPAILLRGGSRTAPRSRPGQNPGSQPLGRSRFMGPEIIVSWVMLFICCPREELKFAPLQEVGTTAMQATFWVLHADRTVIIRKVCHKAKLFYNLAGQFTSLVPSLHHVTAFFMYRLYLLYKKLACLEFATGPGCVWGSVCAFKARVRVWGFVCQGVCVCLCVFSKSESVCMWAYLTSIPSEYRGSCVHPILAFFHVSAKQEDFIHEYLAWVCSLGSYFIEQ